MQQCTTTAAATLCMPQKQKFKMKNKNTFKKWISFAETKKNELLWHKTLTHKQQRKGKTEIKLDKQGQLKTKWIVQANSDIIHSKVFSSCVEKWIYTGSHVCWSSNHTSERRKKREKNIKRQTAIALRSQNKRQKGIQWGKEVMTKYHSGLIFQELPKKK